MTTLYLIRGLPGTGKTTLAERLKGDGVMVAADDWFECADGTYQFDPTQLQQAHQECQRRAQINLGRADTVVVHNTFSQRWEMQPYIDIAILHGARLVVLDLFDGGCTDEQLTERNSHGVPLHAIQRMRERWEHDWKIANQAGP